MIFLASYVRLPGGRLSQKLLLPLPGSSNGHPFPGSAVEIAHLEDGHHTANVEFLYSCRHRKTVDVNCAVE